jgi:hypothetical protein
MLKGASGRRKYFGCALVCEWKCAVIAQLWRFGIGEKVPEEESKSSALRVMKGFLRSGQAV